MGDKMGYKAKNLVELQKKGINIHYFKEISSLSALFSFAKKNKLFSIRFDSAPLIHGLPFYKITEYNENILTDIFNKAVETNCTLLCSNGLQYDDLLICNFVGEIHSGNFILELSSKKIPLREMYNYPTTIIKGNIYDNIKDMAFINKDKNKISNNDIEAIVTYLFSFNINNVTIEGTLYKESVGLLNKNIVCWQIIKD